MELVICTFCKGSGKIKDKVCFICHGTKKKERHTIDEIAIKMTQLDVDVDDFILQCFIQGYGIEEIENWQIKQRF